MVHYNTPKSQRRGASKTFPAVLLATIFCLGLAAPAMAAEPSLTLGEFGSWVITLDPIFSGLAWSFIFGLFASTAFSLLVVPVMYYLSSLPEDFAAGNGWSTVDNRDCLRGRPGVAVPLREGKTMQGPMAAPVLVEVTRGPAVESSHRGQVAVSDAQGNLRSPG